MTALPKSSSREDPGVRAGDLVVEGKYRVERILGQGGMGVVVAAIHENLDERVAIKLLRPEGASRPEHAERFMREARAAVKIKSAHVARVVDVGIETSGRPYIVMEYLQGRDLSEELAATGPLPEAVAVGHVLDACDALAEAHLLGVVHRDLKPSNLFLVDGEDEPTVKVLDFGISKIQDSSILANVSPSITGDTALLGSPFYMSPEQIRSAKDVDGRTDVWSLGVILHELVSGQTPFTGATASGVLAAICADAPIPLRSHRPGASAALAAIVAHCLEKDVAARIPSVRELVVALAAIAPARASVVLERIDRLGAGGAKRTTSTGGRVTSPVAPRAFETNETIASFTQTGAPERRRSAVFFALSAGLVAALGTFLALSLRGNRAPAAGVLQDNPPAIVLPGASVAAAVRPATPVVEPTASPLAALPSATVAAPLPTLGAPVFSAKPFGARTLPSAGSIRLGKEVETRR